MAHTVLYRFGGYPPEEFREYSFGEIVKAKVSSVFNGGLATIKRKLRRSLLSHYVFGGWSVVPGKGGEAELCDWPDSMNWLIAGLGRCPNVTEMYCFGTTEFGFTAIFKAQRHPATTIGLVFETEVAKGKLFVLVCQGPLVS